MATGADGGKVGGQRGQSVENRRGCGLSSMNRQTWAQCKVWGSLDACLGAAALSPLPDHVPVVGDDGPLQLDHGREDPLHLWEGGPYVTWGQ